MGGLRWLSSLLRVAAGVGLIAYLARYGLIDWSALSGLLGAWKLSVLALLLSLAVIVLVSWRLCLLLRAQGYELPLPTAVRLTLVGAFFSALLPGSNGGDLARIYLAARPHRGHGTEITTVILVDRFIGGLALLTLPVLVAVALGPRFRAATPAGLTGLLWVATAGIGVACGIVAAGLYPPVRRLATTLLRWIRVDRYGDRFFDTITAYRTQRKTLVSAFLLSLAIQGLMVASLLVLVRVTGSVAITWDLAVVIPFGMLANALPVTPGGLGVGEAAFAMLFSSVGASGGAETILAWRVVTTVIDLIGGALVVTGRTKVSIGGRPTIPAGGGEATS